MAKPAEPEKEKLARLRPAFEEDCAKVFGERLDQFSTQLRELLWEMWMSAHLRAQSQWYEELKANIDHLLEGSSLDKKLQQFEQKLGATDSFVRAHEELIQHKPQDLVYRGIENGALQVTGNNLLLSGSGTTHYLEAHVNIQVEGGQEFSMNFPEPDMLADYDARREDPIQKALEKRVELMVKDHGDLNLWAHRDFGRSYDYVPTITHRESGRPLGLDLDSRQLLSWTPYQEKLESGSDFYTWDFPHRYPPNNGSLVVMVDGEERVDYTTRTVYTAGCDRVEAVIFEPTHAPGHEAEVIAHFSIKVSDPWP